MYTPKTFEKESDFAGIKNTRRGVALVLRYRFVRELEDKEEINLPGVGTFEVLFAGKPFYMKGISRACYLYVDPIEVDESIDW